MTQQREATLAAVLKEHGGSFKTGPFGTTLKAAEYSRAGVPLVSVGEIGQGTLVISKSTPRVGPEVVRRLSDYVLRSGDIVLGRKGAVDRSALVREFEDGYFLGSDGIRLRLGTGVDPRFVAYQLQSSGSRAWLVRNASGTTMASLNQQILGRLPLRLPSLAEQRAIGGLLTDADHSVTTLQRMVEKKRAIKQGMLQQLLSGESRLPGLTELWSTTTLGELGTFLKGRGVKRDDVRSAGIRCVRYGELYTAFDDYTTEATSFVTPDVAATALPLRFGDVLFAGSGETRHEIGKCVAYLGHTPAVAGGDVIVLRGDQCNSIYLALLANAPGVVSQKARVGQGDAVVHIYSSALAAVEVNLPPRGEQDSIAHVIVDVDREIRVLGQRLRKAEEVKQGMMQELLTGRTRLPVEESAA